MFKNFFYSSLFCFSIISLGEAATSTVLSITNLTNKDIVLQGDVINKDGGNLIKRLSTEGETLALSDGSSIEIKKDEATCFLYPEIIAVDTLSCKWELTSNGMGFFSLVFADTHESLLKFKRKQKSLLSPNMPVLLEGIMQSSEVVLP